MLQSLFVLPLLVRRWSLLRYAILLGVVGVYLLLQKGSTDYGAYKDFFVSACSGNYPVGIEPGFLVAARVWALAVSCQPNSFGLFVATTTIILLAISLTWFQKHRESGYDGFLIFTFYAVAYQVAFNFRGGFATLLFGAAFFALVEAKYTRLTIFGVLAVLTHVQTLPAVVLLFSIGLVSSRGFRVFGLFAMATAATVLMPRLVDQLDFFVLSQGMRYLESSAGRVRIASVPFILIDLAVFLGIAQNRSSSPFLKTVRLFVLFHLVTQVVFFGHAYIASRISKPIEPLIMLGLYGVLQDNSWIRLSRALSVIAVMVIGFGFVVVQVMVIP